MTLQPSTEWEGRLGTALLHNIPDAVIFADREGIVRFWNAGAARIFEIPAEEAIGRSLDIIVPERLRARHWSGFNDIMQTGRSSHAPEELLAVPAQTGSGRTISIQFTVAPVPDDAGGLAGVVAVLRDTTAQFEELKRLRARN